MYYRCGDWKMGLWGIRFREFGLYYKIKAPWNKPLFSERYGYYKFRINFFGWRLIVSR